MLLEHEVSLKLMAYRCSKGIEKLYPVNLVEFILPVNYIVWPAESQEILENSGTALATGIECGPCHPAAMADCFGRCV